MYGQMVKFWSLNDTLPLIAEFPAQTPIRALLLHVVPQSKKKSFATVVPLRLTALS